MLAWPLGACSEPEVAADDEDAPEPEPRSLVTADAGVPVPAERDVFVASKPGAVECPPGDGYEAMGKGVLTMCN